MFKEEEEQEERVKEIERRREQASNKETHRKKKEDEREKELQRRLEEKEALFQSVQRRTNITTVDVLQGNQSVQQRGTTNMRHMIAEMEHVVERKRTELREAKHELSLFVLFPKEEKEPELPGEAEFKRDGGFVGDATEKELIMQRRQLSDKKQSVSVFIAGRANSACS